MGRLSGKNILIIIPKDYYNEEELEIPYELFKNEDANIIVASGKMKAVSYTHLTLPTNREV